MKCTNPLIYAYPRGQKDRGKILMAPSDLKRPKEYSEDNWKRWTQKLNEWAFMRGEEYLLVPCGKCAACKLNYSAEWATRIMLEVAENDHNYFVTLTYDDDHVPVSESGALTLDPKEIQLFIKRLRKHLEKTGQKLRYFLAGEYGENTQRPHYHLILINCHLDTNLFYDTHIDPNYKEHWKSRELEQIWAETEKREGENFLRPKGMIDVATVEWSSAAYVARYCLKKMMNKTDYEKWGIEPEFVRMSRGLGFKYYHQHKDQIYKTDSMVMRTIKGNIGSFKPPKAFDRKLKEENPILYDKIKLQRQLIAERNFENECKKSDYTDLEKMIIDAAKIEQKSKLLPRSLEA